MFAICSAVTILNISFLKERSPSPWKWNYVGEIRDFTTIKDSALVEKVSELLDLITGWTSLGSNNLKPAFPVLSDHICTQHVGGNLVHFLYRTASDQPYSSGVCLSWVNSSLELIPQHVYWVEDWDLHGLLQLADYLCFKSFGSRFSLVLRIIVLPEASVLQLDSPPDTIPQDALRIPFLLSDEVCPRSKAAA